jgi:hypothetical protein
MGGVFACQLPSERQQRDGREDPANGVAGSMGHDPGPYDHEGTEAHKQHDLVGRVLLEGAVGDREDNPKDHADDEDRQHRPGHPGPARALDAASPPPRSREHSARWSMYTAGPSRDRYEVRTHDETMGDRPCTFQRPAREAVVPKDEPHPVVEPVTVCHARARVVLAGRATSVPFTAGLDRYPADNHGQRYTSLERHRSLPSQVTILPDLALGARGRHSNAAIELSQAPQLGAQ